MSDTPWWQFIFKIRALKSELQVSGYHTDQSYLGFWITSEGKMEREINRKITNASAVSDCDGSEGEAQIHLWINSLQLRPWSLGSD